MDNHFTKTSIQAFEDQIKQAGKGFILFSGSKDESGISWCSDCVKADPFVEQYVVPKAKELGVPVFLCEVGLRDEWKKPSHPLRNHTFTKVKGVPTLVWFDNGKAIISIQEEQIYNEEMLEMFLEETN